MTRPAKPRPTIDGAELLDRVHAMIVRYVILPCPEAADAVTLWIAATHAQDAWAYAPRLVIRAPEKRCGKSRLLDVVEGASHNPLMTVNASPAAVYRSIGAGNALTLLVDEADTIFGPKAGENEDLRGLLNAGHQRGRPAIRYDANTQRVETIETFCMAALAGIGQMPDTIEDRAVVVKMRRRAPGETVKPWRIKRDRPQMLKLSAELSAWLTPLLPELESAEPVMPLEDRAADTWEPLIVIADAAGGTWRERARAASLVLTGEAEKNAIASDRVRLLTDCRTAFGTDEALPTGMLIDRLKADQEAPWARHDGTGLTPIKLAGLLREYDIRSDTIRFEQPIGQAKGYRAGDFWDSWNRYCPPTSANTAAAAIGDVPTDVPWYGSSRTTQDPVPPLTGDGTAGTAGTGTPRHLRLANPS
ncbi:hypothetical protein Cme02nite_20900 [Catellatospora methionotrophica]|uniref:DUF3631 domain-containing protein n=1 Tax=Catellatospora methionotrophica TaxID=121620 RepID=A0A8J3PEW5_9ACTN|nr:DUF3631 domain-containing protein [Catellatospora methionotrophica]GIG13758.1 hypothetical protein Cme02nite_20900 [Catellatospora methionotrophica]